MGSSPNVPAPGTSIDPATGKPHQAGLTRAELEAKRQAQAALSQAADDTSSTPTSGPGVTGKGLGSSPNVPAPGTSVDAETGKPHQAGLTRAELEAKKSAENAQAAAALQTSHFSGGGLASSPNVPSPGHSINPATGKPHQEGLTREQLAAKRAKDAASTNEAAASTSAAPAGLSVDTTVPPVETPGRELPGGWGGESSLPVRTQC